VGLLAAVLVQVPVLGASAVEELTKRLPEETIGFAATSGGDALRGDFEKTTLGRIWNDPGVRTFVQSIRTELLTKVKQQADDPNAPQKIEMVRNLVRLALSRPVLLGITQVQTQEGPPIGGFVILDAGDRKDQFAGVVGKLEAMIGPDKVIDTEIGTLKMRGLKDTQDMPLYWGWVGNHLIVAVNDAGGTIARYASQPRAAVPAYLSKVPAHGDALAVHYDYQRIIRMIGGIAREEGGEKQANMLTAAFKGLGLNELRTLTVRVGFSGPDLVAQTFLAVPTPTTGVLAACKPVELSWLGAVDARAITASLTNWDLAGLYDTIMNTLQAVSPDEAFPAVQKALAGFESQAGVRMRADLLASLAGPMASYVMPAGAIMESPMGGFVVVAKLKDAAAFEKSMTALGKFAGEKAGGMLQVSEQTRDDGRTVHVWTIAPLAMMGVMPSWSVASDHVILGSSTSLCDLGVQQLVSKGADGKSLLDTEGYKKVSADLPKNLTNFTYTDAQVQLNQTMMQLHQMWPMLAMLAGQQGVKLPVALPSLAQIAKDIGPSVSYGYAGPDGFYSYHRGPGIEASMGAVAGGAIGAGVALPALAKAREKARTVASMSHLKQIGLALHMYADENDDKLPPDLDKLGSHLPDRSMLESPRKPKGFSGPSYVYVPGQTLEMNPGNIVAYENPEFAKDKILVLFLDGHVEAMTREAFQRELEETKERLGGSKAEPGTNV